MPLMPLPWTHQPSAAPAERKRINLKAVLIILLTTAALGGVVHLVHGFQIRSNAREVLAQALQAEQDGQPELEAEYLATYLGLEPADTGALTRYGLLLKKLAKTIRARINAYSVLANVLLIDPERQDVRRELVSLGMELGWFGEAREHLRLLLEAHPNEVELVILAARCERATGQVQEADKLYGEALNAEPHSIAYSVERANVQRRALGNAAEADKTIARMVDANRESAPARLAAARYFRDTGRLPQAQEQLHELLVKLPAEALQALPEKGAEVYLLAAEVAQARNQNQEMRARLEEGARRFPEDTRFDLRLARLDLRDGRRDQALAGLQRSLRSLPEQLADLVELGDLLIDLRQADQALRVVDRLPGQSKESAAFAEYLRARLLIDRQAWGEARALLEKLRSSQPAPQVAMRVNLLLADCYAALVNPDQQLLACRRALEVDPELLPARLRMASALRALGQFDEAVAQYDRLVTVSPELREERARLLLLRNQRLPAGARRWDEVELALKGLPAEQQKAPDVQMMRAELAAAQAEGLEGKERLDKLVEARRYAEDERRRDTHQVGPWLFLAGLAEREGQPAKFLQVLDDAEKEIGRRVEWQLTRARYWTRSKAPDAAEQLRQIETAGDQLPEDVRGRLALGLALEWARLGDLGAAERNWARAAEREPTNLEVRLRLLERALEEGRQADAERLIGEIRGIEGEGGGLVAFAEASRLAARAREGVQGALAQARQQLAAAATARPSWPAIPVLQGTLFELEGQTDKALEKYREAIEAGEARVGVIRRTLELLRAQGRYADARALLNRLPEAAVESPLSATVVGQVLLAGEGDAGAAGNRQRALELARRAAVASPKDSRAQTWLGEVAWSANQMREAEEALRKARDLDASAPDAWGMLLLFLARTRRKDVEAELTAARGRLPADQLPRVLGPCYEALDRLPEAEAQFKAALSLKRDDPRAQYNLATFYLHHEPARAEPLLRQLIDPATKAASSLVSQCRRDLALVLVQGGDHQRFREALALLEENQKAGGSVFDRRVKALVLATRPAYRREAIELLEATSSQGTPSPEIQFGLARMYEADGRWDLAAVQMQRLLQAPEPNPDHIAYYVAALLRHNEADRAQVWVDRLQKVRPDATGTVELQARVTRARGGRLQAVRLLLDHATRTGARLDVLAHVLDEFDEPAEAEKLYRAHVTAGKDPNAALLLARHLAKRKRGGEALALCEAAWSTSRPEVVANTIVFVVQVGELGAEAQNQAEASLQAAVTKHPGEALKLTEYLGTLEEIRNRPAEAEKIYRQILRQQPHYHTTLNNLAYLLALQEGHESEAVELAQAAVEHGGPLPDYLDSRGVAYLKAGKVDLALKDLQQAVAARPSPTFYFHLARAQQLNKAPSEAAASLRKATDLGLKEAALHPLEQAAVRKLQADLKEGGGRP